ALRCASASGQLPARAAASQRASSCAMRSAVDCGAAVSGWTGVGAAARRSVKAAARTTRHAAVSLGGLPGAGIASIVRMALEEDPEGFRIRPLLQFEDPGGERRDGVFLEHGAAELED